MVWGTPPNRNKTLNRIDVHRCVGLIRVYAVQPAAGRPGMEGASGGRRKSPLPSDLVCLVDLLLGFATLDVGACGQGEAFGVE